MAEEIKNQTRRSAIKTAAQVAVTAPAVGLLLSASATSAMAQDALPYGLQAGDDSSFSDNPLNGNNDQFTVNGVADDFHQGDDDAPGGTI